MSLLSISISYHFFNGNEYFLTFNLYSFLIFHRINELKFEEGKT